MRYLLARGSKELIMSLALLLLVAASLWHAAPVATQAGGKPSIASSTLAEKSAPASAENDGYWLDWSTIDGGGMLSTGQGYTLCGTIGQPDAGMLTGEGYVLGGAFWGGGAMAQKYGIHLPLVVKSRKLPVPETPVLMPISNPDGDGTYVIRWASVPWTEDYLLQEARDSSFSIALQSSSVLSTSYEVTDRGAARYFYRVQARNYSGSSPWSDLESVDVRWELEPNNSDQEANGPLQSEIEYYGYPDDEKDYFGFKTDMAGAISIEVRNHTGKEVQLQLFYQSATDENRKAHDLEPPFQIDYVGPSGWYYIYINTGSGYNQNTPYSISVRFP